jgi:transposase
VTRAPSSASGRCRLQLLDYAARTSVSEAYRTFGVHRSTFYRWKRLVDRHGLEVLRPKSDASRG